MSGLKMFVSFACVLAAACGAESTEAPSLLGIERFQIDETANSLTIVGLGHADQEVGRMTLEIGDFDFESEDRGVVYGRQLAVDVMGRHAMHESEGVGSLVLPLEAQESAIAAFVLEPTVAVALAKRGIVFEGADLADVSQLDESAYACTHKFSGTSYLGNVTHTGCATSSNAKWAIDSDLVGEYRCCSATLKAAQRKCKIDGASGFWTSCGSTGGNGCASCWANPAYDICQANQLQGQGHIYYCANN